MTSFVGAVVHITLKHPPNTVVQGRVREVVPGQALHLEDVYFPQSGVHWQFWTVENSIIADLDILQTAPAPVQLPIHRPPFHHTPPPPPPPPPTTTRSSSAAQHVDPAILSYDRTPLRPQSTSIDATTATPTRTASSKPKAPIVAAEAHTKPDINAAYDHITSQVESASITEKSAKKKSKQSKQRSKQDPTSSEPPPVLNTDVSRNGNDMNTAEKRGKGWRQTPLLQPSHANSPQPKKRRKQRQVDGEAQNGWATEDATDIQDLGEFDFEANHKLFDKQQVFEQLRKDDTTADEDRLVSHNKLPPRKNLLPTEMVLSPKLADGSDADTEVDFHTGRSSSRQSTTKRQASRANSGYLDKPHPLSTSMTSERGISRSAVNRVVRPLSSVAGGIRTNSGEQSPRSADSHRRKTAERIHTTSDDAHFALAHDGTLCPVLLPAALDALEHEAHTGFGLSSHAITELAARCIAEQTLDMVQHPPDHRRPSRTNTARAGLSLSTNPNDSSLPVIVILAGDHSTGARALAAARHLVYRKYKVIIAEGTFEATTAQNEQFNSQLQLLKKAMRARANIKRGAWPKASNYIKSLQGPPVAIIDALLAGTTYDELGELSAAEEARQMIDWANRSRAPVLSVATPSGVSGMDGTASIVEGEPLAVRSDKVLALGTPLTGVLEAVKGGEAWDVSVADVGINVALKAEDAVQFGARWVTALQYTSAAV